MIADLHPLLAQTAGDVLPYLDDPGILEIRVTSSGRCFLVRYGVGKERGVTLLPGALDSFLAVVAHDSGVEWRASSPRLHAAFPHLGIRIQAARPPVSPGIECVIRKHPKQIFPLADFVAKGILTEREATILEDAVRQRQTVLIAGAVGSSKTSLCNALLHVLEDSTERIVICEEDAEIVCTAEEVTFLRCVVGTETVQAVTMRDLCRDVLRLSPDRLVIGEVRDGAALDMVKAFQCGTPGLCTIHADSALGTLPRLEQLILEVSATPQRAMIGEGIDVICHMEQYARRWRCTGLLQVDGFDGTAYVTRSLL